MPKMFTRFVEPGRLAKITYGPYEGKMCTIIDIVDQKRVVVDGPLEVTGVHRHMMPIRRLSLTDLKAKISRGARLPTLKKALESGDVMGEWAKTKEAKRDAAKEFKKNMTDFDRFKLMLAKTKRNKAVPGRPLTSTMPKMFTRFVEPGRLAKITYGPYEGKMCTIIDIVDQKRVVVDGPLEVTGVHRHMMPIRRLSLTDLKAKISRGARLPTLKKALESGEVMGKWAETKEAKRDAAKEFKKNMTDFDRFKLMITYGPYEGKMCTIIDIVDQKRVVVDGPLEVTGVHRHMMPIRRLSLTDLKAKISRGARLPTLKKALESGEIMKQWAETKEAKRMAAKEFKRNMTDFDRFKLMLAKRKRNKAVKKSMLEDIDIVDQKRVVVDGPLEVTGVHRHMMPIRRLSLTDLKTKISRGARLPTLKKALESGDIMGKWAETKEARRDAAKEFKKSMTDFDRFKLMLAKRKRNKAVKKSMLKK
eukprot:CAMPEP_0197942688 /NCGR_PEP_ID=MMETSP1439-20131203/124536_1 /TAXON_ID=66791 /ORGANISM="Gonyaulax spinifera, Strain CCMP409" /LENGTH=475 /DNA_ID=CAMNT_0043565945 /DNA_START=70 /DNA_END=1496 /DNA_ORIENTATION=+